MLRWGILGTSFISDTMAKAINASPKSMIHAVSGRDQVRLDGFAGRHNVPTRSLSHETLITDPDVDVVYVGLPNNLHHEMVIKAAAAGKAVLSEKSLTTTMEDAFALAEAVRSSGIFFMEGLMYLNHPLMMRLGEVLAEGRLGKIRSVTGHYAADIWNVVNPAGGGTLFNLGCYPVSLLHYVMQVAFGPAAFDDRQTQGFGNRSPKDGNIIDASLAIRFGNGLLATLQVSDGFGMDFGFAILGDRATLRFKTNPWLPVAGDNHMEIASHDGNIEEIVVQSTLDGFGHQVARVEECLRLGRKQAPRPSPRLSDSLEIMGLLTEWQAHCEAGNPV